MFISQTGLLEETFIDATHVGAMGPGAVPASLSYCYIEGILGQTLIRGVGLALLEVSMQTIAPVRIGDTIWATVTITGVRPTSAHERAVVDSDVKIFNQRTELVIAYSVRRLIAGRPATAAS